MESTTIPLVGSYNSRGVFVSSVSKDYRARGCIFTMAPDETQQTNAVYLNKRNGWSTASTPAAGSLCSAAISSPSTLEIIAAFGDPNSTIYANTTSVGTISGRVEHITEVKFGTVTYWMMCVPQSPNAGWYLASDSYAQTAYVGDTHSNTTVDNIASTAGMYPGQAITGSGIPANTRIASITSATAIVITAAATATAAGVALTKTPVAKIIDTDFPSAIRGAFVELDGRAYIMTFDRRIYGSESNDPTSWDAENYITCDKFSGFGIGCAKQGDYIIGFCSSWFEGFYNAGSQTGSVLARRDDLTKEIGAAANLGALIAQGQNAVFFVSNTGLGTAVYKLENLQPTKITGQYEENILNNAIPAHISAFYAYGGMCVHLDSASGTDLMYIGAANKWIEPVWTWRLIIFEGPEGSGGVFLYAASPSDTGGRIFNMNNSIGQVWTDSGTAYTMTYQSDSKTINKGDPFIVKRTRLIADNESSGTTNLDMSSDDATNFVDIGDFDMTSTQKEVWGGLYCESSVSFKLEHSANTAFRGQAIVVDWERARV